MTKLLSDAQELAEGASELSEGNRHTDVDLADSVSKLATAVILLVKYLEKEEDDVREARDRG